MKFADVHRYWVRKRAVQDEKPTVSPLVMEEGRLLVKHDYVHMGNRPPLGVVVGEWWWDDRGILQMELWSDFKEIQQRYGP